MKVTVEVGINYYPEKHGHMPDTYNFQSDAIVNIVGGYGIVSRDYPVKAYVTVETPFDITASEKYKWNMAIPGRRSKSGTYDMCFVVCGRTSKKQCNNFGSLNAKELIQEAIDSGMVLIYPDENGDMKKCPVEITDVKWVGSDKQSDYKRRRDEGENRYKNNDSD